MPQSGQLLDRRQQNLGFDRFFHERIDQFMGLHIACKPYRLWHFRNVSLSKVESMMTGIRLRVSSCLRLLIQADAAFSRHHHVEDDNGRVFCGSLFEPICFIARRKRMKPAGVQKIEKENSGVRFIVHHKYFFYCFCRHPISLLPKMSVLNDLICLNS